LKMAPWMVHGMWFLMGWAAAAVLYH